MTTSFKSALILLLTTGLPLAAQQANRALVADAQKDAMGIAEQLYAQARAQDGDDEQRRVSLAQAGELFARYVSKYPRAADKDKALYLQAVCLEECGNHAAANEIMATLVRDMPGEYAAAAAYKLGTQAADRSAWDKAASYFNTVVRQSSRPELKQDALYRLGRAQLQQGKRKDAEASFRSLVDQRNVQPSIAQATLLILAQLKTEDRADTEAYTYYTKLLKLPSLDQKVRGMATLQAARLASKLGYEQDAQKLYDKIASMEGEVEQYAAEAHLDTIIRLYKKGDYEKVTEYAVKYYNDLTNQDKDSNLTDPDKEARRALIVGQAYMELGDMNNAGIWFDLAERSLPKSTIAADAAYRRILCAQSMKRNNVISLSKSFLDEYADPDNSPDTVNLPVCDLVRFIYADRIMASKVSTNGESGVDTAAWLFDAIRIDQLPAALRADAEYKKAWCAAHSDKGYDPISPLNHFIATYKDDARLPEAYTLRGTAYAKQNRYDEALRDFNYVLETYPQSEVLPVCLQKAAEASATKNPQNMVRYYERLIEYSKKRSVKPAAIAEAHYNIACALYNKNDASETRKAVDHFIAARDKYKELYAARVGTSLVQCYFKLKDGKALKNALDELKKSNKPSYDAQPPGILRWCGWWCYNQEDYKAADYFLTEAIAREPKETYTAPDGTQKERPKVEPLVWKCLAKSRLELHEFSSGYEAAQHYLSMETQPYRQAEGMRDMAQLLLGMKRVDDARAICEKAIAMGIDGPIKSSLFITLGDTWYAKQNYSEAAKYYGRVANVVSDKDLKPLASYKLTYALERSDKKVEAEQYRTALKADYPNWLPPADVKSFMEPEKK